MSATARKHEEFAPDATPTEAPPVADPQRRAHLRMVSPLRPEKASRGVFALVVTGMLVAGMVVILLINTSLAQGAFTVSELQSRESELTRQAEALSEQVAAAAAPESLESRARAMGMVPSENPVFIKVPSGRVLGKPKPAGGATASTPRLLTPADATVAEAVDNAGADLPTSLPADYDPAAMDAAQAQAKAANDTAVAAQQQAAEKAARKAARQSAADATKAAKSGKARGENSLWQDSTVMDVTVSTDAGLDAVPVP